MQFFAPILKPYRWHFLLMWQIPFVAAFFYIANAYALKTIVDNPYTIWPIFMLALSAFLQELFCRLAHIAFIKAQTKIKPAIIKKSYYLVQNNNYNYFATNNSGGIVSKIKGIIDGYQEIFAYLWYRLANPFVLIVVGIVSIFFINIKIFLLFILFAIIFFIVTVRLSTKLARITNDASSTKHLLMTKIADNIHNIFTIFAFAKQKYEIRNIDNNLTNCYQKDCQKEWFDFKMAVFTGCIYVLFIIFILSFTFILHQKQQISTGNFVYLVTIMYNILHALWDLSKETSSFFTKWGDFLSSFALLQTAQNLLDKPQAKQLIIS
jgi:ATP-binding cassette subfamily B protein